jgi:putative multiple sugar transport system substrate-binding protein
MRKIVMTTTAVAAVAMLALAGCSPREGSETPAEGGTGFEAGSVIGVALPDKTSENWTIAGGLFEAAIKDAGFEANVQYAGSTSPAPDQQAQIGTMIEDGAKVIVIGAFDSKSLGAQVKEAADAGVKIIAYDRLLEETENVDYYVAFNNFKVGELQGQALLDGLEAAKPGGPWNIELFSGGPTDPNAAVFFNGAMSILQPKIDSGDLKVVSGEVDLKDTATDKWDPANAQTRMDTLLQGSYQSTELDGVLSPNDTLARAVLQSVSDAKKPGIVITGQDSEAASIPYIMDGRQYMTIYKDTRKLVAQTLAMITELAAGDEATTNDVTANGSKDVPTFYLDPIVVTKDNAAEVYKDNETLFPLTQK